MVWNGPNKENVNGPMYFYKEQNNERASLIENEFELQKQFEKKIGVKTRKKIRIKKINGFQNLL